METWSLKQMPHASILAGIFLTVNLADRGPSRTLYFSLIFPIDSLFIYSFVISWRSSHAYALAVRIRHIPKFRNSSARDARRNDRPALLLLCPNDLFPSWECEFNTRINSILWQDTRSYISDQAQVLVTSSLLIRQ